MENCLFEYIFSKWTSPAIVEFNLWLMHSFGVNSPDPRRKLRKSKFPGCTASRNSEVSDRKKKKDWWGSDNFRQQRFWMHEGIMRHKRKVQINLSTSHVDRNLPGRTSLSMNGTALWTEGKLPPAEQSYRAL